MQITISPEQKVQELLSEFGVEKAIQLVETMLDVCQECNRPAIKLWEETLQILISKQ